MAEAEPTTAPPEAVPGEPTSPGAVAAEPAPEAVAAPAEPAPESAEPEPVAEGTDGPPQEETLAPVPDHKRKHEELETEAAEGPGETEAVAAVEAAAAAVAAETEHAEGEDGVQDGVTEAEELTAVATDGAATGDAKRQRLDGETDASEGAQHMAPSEMPIGNGQIPSAENLQPTLVDKLQENASTVPQQSTIPSGGQDITLDGLPVFRKIEVPNNKVGVLIGKAGETIRFLQFNSGAKIQITRDVDSDPHSSSRPVELTGTIENINKAEQLIKDVIAEADAGGSPSLVARGFGASQHGAEQLQIQVPNEKVGMIIGKGGETIKSLQARSGARIQLIPQHLPEGDISKERTVRITGNKEQIEAATELIKEVMSQVPTRSSMVSGGHTQRMYRPRGPTSQWGPRAMPPGQPMTGYGYQQRGSYHSQATQHPPSPYGGYVQQPAPRGSFGTGWDQRAAAPIQASSQMGGYDNYGQGGHLSDVQTSAPGPVSTVAGTSAGPVNYYGQSQAPSYGQPPPYQQSTPGQTYGHGYDEVRYDNQAPNQQVYGQPPVSSQAGVYPHPSATPQAGYAQQQPYNNPPYGGAASQGMPQSYGPPRPSQPGDTMYQASTPYGPTGPTQQQPYPYGSSTPSQQAPGYAQPFGQTSSGTADGYAQYPQQGGQAAPMYAQGTQPAPAYAQGAQSGGYSQHPSSQPSYGEQPVASNATYGYQGGPTADPAYSNNLAASGYGIPSSAGGQAGYTQQSSNPSGYEQSVPPQAGYGNAPGGAPVGYAKSLSPQPGYGQYDSSQMYAQH
uniref:Far upstream element-binding protein 2 n=1 Tax=Anthurium amnicola TaxID=1678845 RepID=A0A1D1YDH5_9ARAE